MSAFAKVVSALSLTVALAFANVTPAAATAPLGSSNLLKQTQTQNLPGVDGANSGEFPGSVVFNDRVYYVATSDASGREVFTTDGTPAGTYALKEISAGAGSSYPSQLAVADGKLYFNASGPQGYEPYISDGTGPGTALLKDISTNLSSSPQFFTGVGNKVFFSADANNSSSGTGRELYVTDGTSAGTSMVLDINTTAYTYYGNTYAGYSNPQSLVGCNGKMFFVAQDGVHGYEAWVSDGTAVGTFMLKDAYTGNNAISAYGDTSIMTSNLTCVGTTMFYRTYDSSLGGYTLYKSDGTTVGTVPVIDSARSLKPTDVSNIVAFNGQAFFTAYDSTNGYELWRSDGTNSGTVIVKNINSGSASSSPSSLTLHDGKLFFSATDSRGSELWSTDGTTVGTLFIKDINLTAPGASSTPKNFYSWQSRLYFTADNGSIGRELWITDGTGTGTTLVKDIFPGISDILDTSNYSQNQPFFAGISGGLIFTANSPIYSQEMWVSDGTNSGTRLLVDAKVGPGYSYAQNAVAFNGKIYFSASSAYFGHELWSTDLTTGATQQVIDIYPGAASGLDWNQYLDYPWYTQPKNMAVYKGRLYFTARTASTGYELWSTDGTAAGTSIVQDMFNGSTGYGASNLTTCNGNLYFSAYQYNAASSWIGRTTVFKLDSNGLPVPLISNTSANLPNWDANPMACTDNGTLFFGASDTIYSTGNGRELWKTDGTEAGTVMVKDINPGLDSNNNYLNSDPQSIVAIGNSVYFRANDPTLGWTAYVSDGTSAGTKPISQIQGYSGDAVLDANNFVAYQGKVWFNGYNSTNGWSVYSFNPSTNSATRTGFTWDYKPVVMGGLLWYNSYISGKGYELTTSDGTLANTGIFEDLIPNAAGSSPNRLAAVGNILFYNTYDSNLGSQPRYVVGQGINTVKFVGNGETSGIVPADISVMAISASVPGNTGNLAKTGYTFTGWNTSPTGVGQAYLPNSTITPIVDTPLYAQWASVQGYSITYDANGADGGVVPTALSDVKSTIELAGNSGALTKAGYKFDGWYTNINSVTTNYAAGARFTPSANTTMYAKWTQLPTFTISFNANGSTSGTAPTALTGVYSTTTLPNQGSMLKTGFTFAGWNTAADGLGNSYAAGETLLPQANMTLYAQWTAATNYTLTYSANNSTSGTAPADAVAASTYVVIDSNSGNLRRTGYTFAGWNTAPDGSGTTYLGSNNFLLNANTTLYAKWLVANYTVSFNANGSSGGATPADITGVQVSTTLPTNSGNLVKAGYNFVGWNTLASGLGTDYAAGSTFSPTTDTTLYAKWTSLPTYTISYDANGATSGGAPVAQSGVYAAVNLDTNSGNLAKSGSYFAGWNTAADGSGQTYSAGESYTPTASITLFALWTMTPTFTLSYDGNGKTAGVAPISQTGITSTVRAASNSGSLQKLGFRFDGWNTLSNGTAVPGVAGGTGDAYAPGDTITITADTTLYAIWTAVPTFTLSYSGNSQTGGSVPQAVTTSEATVTLSANVNSMYRTGYTFNGWNTRADGTGTHYAVGDAFPISANTTIYVDWLRDSYTVTYNSNGATAGTVPGVTAGSGTLNLAQNSGNLSKTGYIFSGWNTASDGSGTSVAVGGTFTPSQNTTMFAKWVTYTITYSGNGSTGGTVPSSQSGISSLNLASNTGNLVKNNYYFNGWNTNAGGTGTNYQEGDSFTPTANITLYASWSSAPIYTLTFDANGATTGSAPSSFRGIAATISLPANTGSMQKTGYEFVGWNTLANGQGTGYAASASYGVSRTETLYADWLLIQHTLTYSPNGANTGTPPQAVTQAPGSVTLSQNAGLLQKGGYTFSGWNTRADGTGTRYAIGDVFSLNSDTTLYALWTPIPGDDPIPAKKDTTPKVEKLSSNVYGLSGGKMSISGTNLNGVVSILLDGKPIKIERQTDSEIFVLLPKMPAGEYELTVLAGDQKFTIASRVKAVPNKLVRVKNFFDTKLNVTLAKKIEALRAIQRYSNYETAYLALGSNSRANASLLRAKELKSLAWFADKWASSELKNIVIREKAATGRSVRDLVLIFTFD